MKSRIVILLSVTLAALLLVVGVVPKAMPTSPVLAQIIYDYQYVVPFTCGTAVDEKEGVKPANYCTTVTIHNPQWCSAVIQWKVAKAFPNPMRISGFIVTSLAPDFTLCIRCKQICPKLGMAFPPPRYITGFVVIQSDEALDVYGVYTAAVVGAQGTEEVSVDLEHIPASIESDCHG